MAFRLGIDVGGTFTDLLLHDSDSGRTWVAKTPSTPSDQSVGVLEGVRLIGEMAEIAPRDLAAGTLAGAHDHWALPPQPPFLTELLAEGGLVPWVRRRLQTSDR